MSTPKLIGIILIAVGSYSPNVAMAQSNNQSSASSENRVLEEVVVTATRREGTLQDAALSVSALSGELLSEIGAMELDDYFGFVPSMNSASNTIGERGGKNIAIRGVSNTRIASSTDTGSLQATTSFYINDVPITAVDTQLFDVERIEILRGPQGTLYGAASMGGAVKMILNKPDLYEFEGAAEVGLHAAKGGGEGADINAMISVPIFEGVFGLRATVSRREQDGFIDSAIIPLDNTSGRLPPLAGETLPAFSRDVSKRDVKDSNSATSTGGTISALYTPNDKLRVELTGLWQLTENDDLNFVNTRYGGEFRQEKYVLEPNQSEATLAAMNVSYDLGPVSLVANMGDYRRTYDEVIDFTQSMFRRSILDTGPSYADVLDFIPAVVTLETSLNLRARTGELRVESNRDTGGSSFLSRLDWVVGYFGLTEDRQRTGTTDGLGWEAAAPDYPLSLPNDLDAASVTDIEDESSGFFADANFRLTDRIEVGAGIRFFDMSTGLVTTAVDDDNLAQPIITVRNQSESGETVRLNASYDLSDATMIFATYADGFRLGGASAPINLETNPTCFQALEENGLLRFADGRFDSDLVETLELGVKKTIGDRRATVNISAYHTDWSGLQQQLRVGDLSDTCFAVITANAGKAEVNGAEVELSAIATDRVFINATLSYTDATIVDPGPGGLSEPGDRLLNTPEWSGSLIGRYEVPTNALGGGTFFLQGDMRYIGDREPTTGNSNPERTLDANVLIGARVGFRFGSDGSTTLTLWGKNLTDDRVEQNSRNRIGVPDVIINHGLPRTFGLSVRKDF